jgi:hypothetical protein
MKSGFQYFLTKAPTKKRCKKIMPEHSGYALPLVQILKMQEGCKIS